MADRMQFRRDTAANWTAYNPILLEGELGFVLGTQHYKLGDGIHAWNDLELRGFNGNIETEVLNDENSVPSGAAVEMYHNKDLFNRAVFNCILPLELFDSGIYNNAGRWNFGNKYLYKIFSVKDISKIKFSCVNSSVSSAIKYSFRTGVFPDSIPVSGSIIDLEIPIGEKVEINVPNDVNYIQIYKNDYGESTFFYNTLLVEFVSKSISELKSGLELEIPTRQSEDAKISANSSGDVWHSFIDRNNGEVIHASTSQYTVASPFFKILKTTNPIVIKNVFKGNGATPLTFYDKNAGLLSQVVPDGETGDYDITVAAEDIPEDAVYFRVTSRVQDKRYEVTNGQIVSAESILPNIRNKIITVTELTVLSSSMTVARIPVKGGSIVKLVSADWNETRNGTTMRMSSGDIHYGITFLGGAKMYPGRYFKIQDDTRYIDFVVSDKANFNSITVEILDKEVSDSIRKDYLTNSRNGIIKTLLPSDFFAGVYVNNGNYGDGELRFFSCVLDVIPNQRFKITNIDAATTPKYSYRNINPIDGTATYIGGNADIVLNNEYTIPNNCNAVIIYFNDADVENWYLNSITYEIIADNEKRFESIETDIDTLNENSQIINASPIQIISTFASRMMSLDGNNTTGVARHRRLVVAHITDTHDDRERVQRFANFVENHSIIDFAVHTGDVVRHTNWQTYFNYFTNKMCYLSIGNHEGDEYSEHLVSNLKSGYMQPLVDKGVSVTSHCAYYEDKTDADGHVIRFIFLNEYDYPDSVTRAQMNAAGANGYYNAIFSQEQIDWFIARLQECITNNYYVCICSHQKPVAVQMNTTPFCQDNVVINSPGNNYDGNMLLEIINAFKNSSTLNKSYAPKSSYLSLLPTISVNVTFASKGKFIAWMNGHNHGDYIGYDSIYKNQLILNNTLAKASSFIVSGGSHPGERLYSDLPRDIDGDTQDAYNVYVFDIDNSKVHVVRIGSNLNYNGRLRKYASYNF